MSFTTGFRPALAVVAALSVVGAVTALGVNGRRRTAVVGQPEMVEPVAAAS
jgi:hypothetical protein